MFGFELKRLKSKVNSLAFALNRLPSELNRFSVEMNPFPLAVKSLPPAQNKFSWNLNHFKSHVDSLPPQPGQRRSAPSGRTNSVLISMQDRVGTSNRPSAGNTLAANYSARPQSNRR